MTDIELAEIRKRSTESILTHYYYGDELLGDDQERVFQAEQDRIMLLAELDILLGLIIKAKRKLSR